MTNPKGPGEKPYVPHGAWLLLPAGALLFLIWLGYVNRDADPNFFSDMAATAAAVFAGGFVALWSERSLEGNRQEREEARERAAEKAALVEALKLEWRVLGLLHDELGTCLKALADPAGRAKRPRPDLAFTPLPVETWSALSSSGELRHITNPDLVGYFAEAYHWVGLVNRYEGRCLDLQFDSAGVVAAPTSAAAATNLRTMLNTLLRKLEEFDEPTIQEVGEAVELADRRFGEVETEIAGLGGTPPKRLQPPPAR